MECTISAKDAYGDAKAWAEHCDKLQRALAAAQERIKALEKRLEIVPGHPYDGIDCRDETIRLADERIRELRENGTRLVEAADGWKIRCQAEEIIRVRVEAERDALRDPNHPDNYEGSTLQRLDDLVHELTGDEGEDDSFTVLRRAWDALREDADSLARALISVRQQMFPGTDQRAVISRDFPRITSIAAIDRERQK